MPRATKRCAKIGCRQPAPCKTHRVWQSESKKPLPSNWKTLRKSARGFAEKRCYVCNRVRPGGAVDHIIPRSQGGPDHPANLAWICDPCHKEKSDIEKNANKRR